MSPSDSVTHIITRMSKTEGRFLVLILIDKFICFMEKLTHKKGVKYMGIHCCTRKGCLLYCKHLIHFFIFQKEKSK